MDAKRLCTGFDSEPFHTKLYNPRWPHTPAEYTLEMRVDVEILRMKIPLSQPTPPLQCYSSPRRSPAVETRSDETGTLRAESQLTEREGSFPLQVSPNNVRHVSTSLDQKSTIILLQLAVGVDDEEKTTTKAQVAARKEFAKMAIGRQPRETASTQQSKQFHPGG